MKILTDARPLEFVGHTVRRLNLLALPMAILSLAKEPRLDCGKKSPAKRRCIKSFESPKGLLCLFSSVQSTWQKFTSFTGLTRFVICLSWAGGGGRKHSNDGAGAVASPGDSQIE